MHRHTSTAIPVLAGVIGTMRHRLRSTALSALAGLALAGTAAAGEPGKTSFYVGLAADVAGSELDPRDYDGVAEEIAGALDGTGAAALYLGVRRGRHAIEAGWIFGDVTPRWQEPASPGPGDTVHVAELETGGPFVAGLMDVYSFEGALDGLHLYAKAGVERAHRWVARRDGAVTARGGSGVTPVGGGGARFEFPGSGLELRAEAAWRFDDAGTQALFRTGVGWRF